MELKELLWGSESSSFALEIALRTLVMYLMLILLLKSTGKRGVRQLSMFEMVMIIALGSAAGDPMLYKDVGLLSATIVFLVIIIGYRLIISVVTYSEKAEFIFEGRPEYIIKDGIATNGATGSKSLGVDEFFSELRTSHVEHLGQVYNVILETSGTVSILFRDDEEVVYGLPIWPHDYYNQTNQPEPGVYHSCTQCGHTLKFTPESSTKCEICRNEKWVKSLNTKRKS